MWLLGTSDTPSITRLSEIKVNIVALIEARNKYVAPKDEYIILYYVLWSCNAKDQHVRYTETPDTLCQGITVFLRDFFCVRQIPCLLQELVRCCSRGITPSSVRSGGWSHHVFRKFFQLLFSGILWRLSCRRAGYQMDRRGDKCQIPLPEPL